MSRILDVLEEDVSFVLHRAKGGACPEKWTSRPLESRGRYMGGESPSFALLLPSQLRGLEGLAIEGDDAHRRALRFLLRRCGGAETLACADVLESISMTRLPLEAIVWVKVSVKVASLSVRM
ncbi:MAG: hypothetical protein ACKO6N_00570 [Myxococcota bacterium]